MSFQLNFTHQGATHEIYLEKGAPSKESVTIGGKVFKLLGSEESISLFKSYMENPEKTPIIISPIWKASLERFGPYRKTEELFQETVSQKTSSESFAVQKAQSSLTEAQITRLNKVISKAAFLFEMDEAQIREILSRKKYQETLLQAFEAKIARVVFPGEKEDPTKNGEYIDGVPSFASDMTLREKMVLGTLATILGKTDLLESLCMQSAIAEGVQGEMITIDPAAHRKLHIIPFGEHREGATCVLMEGGLGQSAENWQKTMNLISHDTYGLTQLRQMRDRIFSAYC